MHNQILDTDELKNELDFLFPRTKTMIFISAFITDNAVDWMLERLPSDAKKCFVAKLAPQDFTSGASTFSAIRKLLDIRCEVKLLENLHAKIYLINQSDVFVGSANFTNNGLKLFGAGNIEASIKLSVTPKIYKFITNISTKASSITLERLEKMELALKDITTSKSDKIPSWWGDDIINSTLCLWTADMIQEEITSSEIENDADKRLLFGNMDIINSDNAGFYFKQTKIYKWLINELKQDKDNAISFGLLSKKLHDSINDDPIPYRKTVKQYLNNLLSYCKIFANDEVVIERPNYSEIIRLRS